MSRIDVEKLRDELPALRDLSYLNTGTAGPVPTPVRDAMLAVIDGDLQRGRTSWKRFVRIAERIELVRALLAGLVNVEPESVALTTGTADGIDSVISSMRWADGDCIVTTSIEHPAALIALYQATRRHDVDIRFVEIAEPFDEDTALAAIRDALDERVRLVMISHVAFDSGMVMPVSEIATLAAAAGARLIVDGAQAAGALEVDVEALGCDYYAFPGHKWLLGPEGTGALIVREDALGELVGTRGTVNAVEAEEIVVGMPDSLRLRSDARRLETGSRSNVVWAGLQAALEWRAELDRGTGELAALIQKRASYARSALEQYDEVELLTPENHAGLITFRLDGACPLAIVAELGTQRIAARAIEHRDAVRVSCAFFTTEAEIDRLTSGVSDLTMLLRGTRAGGGVL